MVRKLNLVYAKNMAFFKQPSQVLSFHIQELVLESALSPNVTIHFEHDRSNSILKLKWNQKSFLLLYK